ncbi:hypothetical protein [Pseudomonas viridiflava]|uniref:hypothetical protein n=1 Tax=Pseudomonas viridiflava TaxID=33069 RepID=UPI000F028644|nr:hypothetical protein [Pseudomonas viridiflava]
MLDAVPEVNHAYVQPAAPREGNFLEEFNRQANASGQSQGQKERLDRALQGIYLRGHQAFIPEKNLPIFTAKDGDKTLQTRIVRHGTITESLGPESYVERYGEWIDKKTIADINNPKRLTGQAWTAQRQDGNGVETCGVTVNIDSDSSLHLYTNGENPILYPRNMTNSMMEAHESEHCLYRPATEPSNLSIVEKHFHNGENEAHENYRSSVRETSADLAATLRYATETGSFAINDLLIKPMRLSNPLDMGHTSVSSLQAILKCLKPEDYKGMDPTLIPAEVEKLMVKYFENGKGFLLELESPDASAPMKAMAWEFAARQELKDYRRWDGMKLGSIGELGPKGKALGKDALMAVRQNHEAFSHLVPEIHKAVPENVYSAFVKRYGLEELDELVGSKPGPLQKPEPDPKLDRVLDVMMGL